MKRIGLAILAAWLAWPVAVSAHDVPDLVNVAVFFKPQNGRTADAGQRAVQTRLSIFSFRFWMPRGWIYRN